MTNRSEPTILRDLATAIDRLERVEHFRRYGSGGMGKFEIGFTSQPGSEGFAILMERVAPEVLRRWDELRDAAVLSLEADVARLRSELAAAGVSERCAA